LKREEKKKLLKSYYDKLIENAMSELDAVDQSMDGVTDFVDHSQYEWLIKEFDRMQKSDMEKEFRVVYRFDKPELLAIFRGYNYEVHPLTMQSNENDKQRKQKESVRKRLHEYNKKRSKEARFSFDGD
jgi:adenylate kinase family enzyme